MAGPTRSYPERLRLLAAVVWLALFVMRPQLILALTFLLIGGGFIVFNGVAFWVTVIRKEPFSSVAPIAGGLVAAVGVAFLPIAESWKWAWLPLVLDWGGVPRVLAAWHASRARPAARAGGQGTGL